MSPCYPFNIIDILSYSRSKIKVTGSQSELNVEGDRVAGVSLHSIECRLVVITLTLLVATTGKKRDQPSHVSVPSSASYSDERLQR